MSKTKLIATVLGVLLVGGAVYSYSVNANNTEKIFLKASDKVSSLKFVKQKIDLSISIKDTATLEERQLPAGVYPTIDVSAVMIAPKLDTTGATADVKSSTHVVVSTKNMEPSIGADLDMIMLKQTLLYAKLNQLTGVPFDLSQFEKKWWKFDLEALAKKFGGPESDTILESLKTSQLSKEKMEQIKTIAAKYKKLAHINKLPDGQLEGMPAYHFSMSLDKQQLIQMLTEVIQVVQKDSKDMQEIKASDLEEAFKHMDIKSIDIYIAKNEYLPAQVKMSFEMSDVDGNDAAGMDLAITFSGSDPVEIVAPTSSTDIMELISGFMSGVMGNSGMVTPPTR